LPNSTTSPTQKERDKAQADFEAKKQSIIDNGANSLAHIDDKFAGSVTNAESVIAKETVGLVTAEQFRKIRERATRKDSVGSAGDGEEEKKVEVRGRGRGRVKP
jgi:hypothetical protein